MPFRPTFDCLWCGTPHACRGPDDLEGWAQLCSGCVGKAGDNGFLRFRLHEALTERGLAAAARTTARIPSPSRVAVDGPPGIVTAPPSQPPTRGGTDRDAEMLAYYEARAPEYDDWYLRRGRYAQGPIHDTAWNSELDAAGRWLDGLPIRGEIVELAAGTGWWSPLLATKGDLTLYDGTPAPLDRARERLVAHGLRAHLHVRDAWADPDRVVDAVFTGFWLSHIPRDRLDSFLGIVRRWLKPGGTYAFIDSKLDPQSSAVDHPAAADDVSVRRLADGREFTVVKVFYRPAELASALARAGFEHTQVSSTGRFFLTGVARAV
jgi:demethylmenaquinone methyltransferase/2-methoxy-6-polyprenyl-1,4-benzoquinol methylase